MELFKMDQPVLLLAVVFFLPANAAVVHDGDIQCVLPGFMYLGKSTWQNAPVFDDENHYKDVKNIWTLMEDRKTIKIQEYDQKVVAYFRDAAGYDTTKIPSNEFNLRCVSNPKENHVIMEKSDGVKRTFFCYYFEKMSKIVIRFAKSREIQELTDDGASLCTEKLFTSPTPLLYFEISFDYTQNLDKYMFNKNYTVCPLHGGYQIESIYSTLSGKLCSGKYESSKYAYRTMDNECESGQGLSIPWPLHGPKDHCETLSIRTYCMAYWSDGKYTYMLLTDNRGMGNGYAYCARYLGVDLPETPLEQSVTNFYVFNNSICDNTDELKLQKGYVKYEISKKNNYQMGICSDDYEDCKSITPEECSAFNSATTCSESCNYCPNPRPWSEAKFDERFQGKFFSNSLLINKKEIMITKTNLNLSILNSLQTYRVFGENVCPTRPNQTYGSFNNVTTYLMMKEGTKDGCYPTLAILAIKVVNPSVLMYKISNEVSTRTTFGYPGNNMKKPEDWDLRKSCRMLFFHSPPFRQLRNVFKHDEDAWDVLIRENPSEFQTECAQLLEPVITLKREHFLNYEEHCIGSIIPAPDNSKFTYDIEKCVQGNNESYDFPKQKSVYECMAVFEGESETEGKFIITKTVGGSNHMGLEYICWVLSDSGSLGYWLPVGNCYPAIFSDIKYRNRQPIATLHSSASVVFINYWILSISSIALSGIISLMKS